MIAKLLLLAAYLLANGHSMAFREDLQGLKFPFDLPKAWGPWTRATVGQVWPQPQVINTLSDYMILRPHIFQFRVKGQSCDILDAALRRYYDLIFYPARGTEATKKFMKHYKKLSRTWEKDDSFRGYLDFVTVHLTQACEKYPSLEMDEKYSIEVDSNSSLLHASISSSSIWGILRGLETFSQLVYIQQDGIAFQINSTSISDFPRFAHRGLMLDSSRHFLNMKVIKESLDLMAQNKFNVFHWHLTDDPSFPYVSKLFPGLSKGAFDEHKAIYTPADVQEIIEYARMRGIRVIPEFDTPGHTQSWRPGVEGLLTACFKEDGVTPTGFFGPIDPTLEQNYKFLEEFFGEVFQVFPDAYVHLGGDEVEFDCWASNRKVIQFMREQGFGDDYTKLEQYFMQRLINGTQRVTKGAMQALVWQEVIDNNVTLPSHTVIHVWKDGVNFQNELAHVTSYGYRTLLSSPWYLNYISYGIDWDKYYNVEPLAFNGTDAQKQLVIGGEACMWGEFVDGTSVIPRTWPRASAVAERLWSAETVRDARRAVNRLQEHRCRLLRRGFNIDPVNGVDFCDVD